MFNNSRITEGKKEHEQAKEEKYETIKELLENKVSLTEEELENKPNPYNLIDLVEGLKEEDDFDQLTKDLELNDESEYVKQAKEIYQEVREMEKTDGVVNGKKGGYFGEILGSWYLSHGSYIGNEAEAALGAMLTGFGFSLEKIANVYERHSAKYATE